MTCIRTQHRLSHVHGIFDVQVDEVAEHSSAAAA